MYRCWFRRTAVRPGNRKISGGMSPLILERLVDAEVHAPKHLNSTNIKRGCGSWQLIIPSAEVEKRCSTRMFCNNAGLCTVVYSCCRDLTIPAQGR
ncbi:unnamed protein product [Victoria cruziana]